MNLYGQTVPAVKEAAALAPLIPEYYNSPLAMIDKRQESARHPSPWNLPLRLGWDQ